MELIDFKCRLIDQIKLNSVAEMTSDKEEFLNYVSEILIEAEEIDEFIYLPFEGLGRKGRKIQIDGYSFNELDESLAIFVLAPLTYQNVESLTNFEAERIISRARAFIEESDYVIQNAEESSPGYGLAIDINNKYKNIRSYCIYLVSDMLMSKSIKEIQSTQINEKNVEYHIWDIGRFFALSESNSVKEDIIINLKEFSERGIPCLPASITTDYNAYLCNIPGIILATLYNTFGGRLLEGNVRSFLQTKGKVNKGIRATILNDPSMFFAYNNGIAGTAYDIKIEEYSGTKYITEITSLQIVNGGQTTASLAMALLNDKKDGSEDKLKEIFVPMKLSVVSPMKAQNLIPNISRYANSQNKVSDADLWSNHPFHIRIEEFSRRILAPSTKGQQYGTYWYYERANGQYKQELYKSTAGEKKRFEMHNPKTQMFTKTDLAKYMNIFLLKPHIASAGGQKAFTVFAEWASTQWDKNETNFNEAYFKKMIALTIIFRSADKIVKRQEWYNSYKANIVAYTISKIIFAVKNDYPDRAIAYRNIWQKQELSIAWVNQIEVLSEIMYNHLIDKSRGVENVTEWAKRETCWERAKSIRVTLNNEFVKELDYKINENENIKEARKEQVLTNKVSAMVDVANYGAINWQKLIEWNKNHNVLTPIDVEFIKYAIEMENGKFPSEKQCLKIMGILEKARIESYPL